MAKQPTLRLYTDRDMIDVVDEFGNELAPVPKSWLGTDKLPNGVVKAGSKGAKATPPPDPTVEPAGNASTEAWVAFAKAAKSAKDEDFVNEQGEALTRDELRAKYGTAS